MTPTEQTVKLINKGEEVLLAVQRVASRIEARIGKALRNARPLLPVGAWCKRICDDGDEWHRPEALPASRYGRTLTHDICPDCARKLTDVRFDSRSTK